MTDKAKKEAEVERRKEYENCTLCPRRCGINRYEARGFCGCGPVVHIAKTMLHRYEEPMLAPLSGKSGAVFFSGCPLGCVYCQNKEISRAEGGEAADAARLSAVFISLEKEGAENIDLITADHYLPDVIDGVKLAKKARLHLPVVYNCSGYERKELISLLSENVDIFLFDFKYLDPRAAKRYSRAEDYGNVCYAAIEEAFKKKNKLIYDKDGKLLSGIIVRHLLLPGRVIDAKRIVKRLYESFGDDIIISLMSQYLPTGSPFPELERTVTETEYRSLVRYAEKIGVTNALVQDPTSADKKYIPGFKNS